MQSIMATLFVVALAQAHWLDQGKARLAPSSSTFEYKQLYTWRTELSGLDQTHFADCSRVVGLVVRPI